MFELYWVVVPLVSMAHVAGTTAIKPDASTTNSSITDSKGLALIQGKCLVPETEVRYCGVPGTHQGISG